MSSSFEVGLPICCEFAEISCRALVCLIYYHVKKQGGAHDPHALRSSQESFSSGVVLMSALKIEALYNCHSECYCHYRPRAGT